MRRCAGLTAVLLLASMQGLAQSGGTTFSVGVHVVNLLATVRDSEGRLRNDLARDEFRLQVDGRPQEITYFARQTDLPLTLGLLIDTSASMLPVFDKERTEGSRFLKQVLRPREDQAFLMRFDRDVQVLQSLTTSRRQLQAGLSVLDSETWFARQMERPASQGRRGASTALYDAIVQAAEQHLSLQRERKAIVLLSDGVDDGSAHSLEDAIGAALRRDVMVYAIRVFSENGYSTQNVLIREEQRRKATLARGKNVLVRLARETGGGFFEAVDGRKMDSVFAAIGEELRSEYSLGFVPGEEALTPGFHSVVLTVVRSGMVVRTRSGYVVER